MIFRAVFWIGLVSLLMPHEPDLGFGRPGVASPGAAGLASVMPSGAGNLLYGVHTLGIRSIDEVRADLAAHRTKFHGI